MGGKRKCQLCRVCRPRERRACAKCGLYVGPGCDPQRHLPKTGFSPGCYVAQKMQCRACVDHAECKAALLCVQTKEKHEIVLELLLRWLNGENLSSVDLGAQAITY